MKPAHIVVTVVGAALALGGVAFAQTQAPTRTIEHLQTATRSEAEAAQRYAFFASRAEEEGFAQVAKLFRAAAESERIHRRNHEAVLRALGGSVPEVRVETVAVGDTRENLRNAMEGEREASGESYPAFIRDAQRERVGTAVRSFGYARDTEAQHKALFKQALADLGRNANVDFLVHSETGLMTMQVPGNSVPVTKPATTGAPEQQAQPRGTPAPKRTATTPPPGL